MFFSWELVYLGKTFTQTPKSSSPGRTLNQCNLPFTQRLILCSAKNLHTMKHCLSGLTSEGPSETSPLDSPSMLNQLICSPVAQDKDNFCFRASSILQCSPSHGSQMLCSCSGSPFWFTTQLLPVRSYSEFYCTHITCNSMLIVLYIYIRNMELEVTGKHLYLSM